eukprot:CAMPEP_0194269342 /NCGR_PEP_ID=MMETSP0169-20130528/3526_1 /TAXON_ID=218684 /ORGANISM="Corethron pennatum, Strain L29A3" /LENGTH=731 /DNA_ID=CAMNT_0039010963 /DNA_START=26 /DNA_END=2221 /DNA_ORIENTATION=-
MKSAAAVISVGSFVILAAIIPLGFAFVLPSSVLRSSHTRLQGGTSDESSEPQVSNSARFGGFTSYVDSLSPRRIPSGLDKSIADAVDNAILGASVLTKTAPADFVSHFPAPSSGVHDPASAAVADTTQLRDDAHMRRALDLASATADTPNAPWFPGAPTGAVLVHTPSGDILGTGISGCRLDENAVRAALEDAGVRCDPLREWAVGFSPKLRRRISESTLYLTSEPGDRRRGSAVPSVANLIVAAGIPTVIIGTEDPVSYDANRGAAVLHAAGIDVSVGQTCDSECRALLEPFTRRTRGKLRSQARAHFRETGRPLGILHCSVIDSNDASAYARNGNVFGKTFGGALLNERNFGAYELAPPPQKIWMQEEGDNLDNELEDLSWEYNGETDYENEEDSLDNAVTENPMLPWYEQVDAVVATFPRVENTPADDCSISFRLESLRWFCSQGASLSVALNRIFVLDASDLIHIPMSNDDPRWDPNLDVEKFWRAEGTKVIIRRGRNLTASAAAAAAAAAASAAAIAAERALAAVETGDAEVAAEDALAALEAAMEAARQVREEAEHIQSLKQRLVDMGVTVETIQESKPIDVMNFIGKRWGFEVAVWRAGCWGKVGVESIVNGAFQWISAHLSVDADGGRFWQLILAEQCVQAACGSKSEIQVVAEQDDLNLQYCDGGDEDCELMVDDKFVRHVRIDCRIALVDEKRTGKIMSYTMEPMPKSFEKHQTLEGPWFL